MWLRRLRPVLACCAAALLVAALQSLVPREGKPVAVLSLGTNSKPILVVLGGPNSGSASPPSKAFTIEGNVGGLFPGGAKQILLTVRNPNRQAITVTSLNVAVGSIGPCAASNLWVTNFSGQLIVGAQTSSTRSVPIGMFAAAGNECKDASFALTFTGTAEMR